MSANRSYEDAIFISISEPILCHQSITFVLSKARYVMEQKEAHHNIAG